MNKGAIISLRSEGYSFRQIHRITGVDRKTASKYWNEYIRNEQRLAEAKDHKETLEIQEAMTGKPKYNTGERARKKLTPEFFADLEAILESEDRKRKLLGINKQALTKKQIHEQLRQKGHDVSYSTVTIEIKRLQGGQKECYIRQEYEYGDRLEYDFGEIKLMINGECKHYYLAVLCSPASKFRWCYLYENAKKDVFLDSHVRFFDMIGGVWNEVVYDNMRNVVSKFIGRTEKQLNPDLISLSAYYGFRINVTNAFSGNEKGSVERSVEVLRNEIFATRYSFASKDEAMQYMEDRLKELNKDSKIEEEKLALRVAKPPLELAEIRSSKVSKYSFIKVDNHFYSVPDILVGQRVTTKIYPSRVLIYYNNHYVCEHPRLRGEQTTSADIRHYLRTLARKPGAVRNSLVLKSNPELKLLYDKYYSNEPKKFIALLSKHCDLPDDKLIDAMKREVRLERQFRPTVSHLLSHLTRNQTSMYNSITLGSEK